MPKYTAMIVVLLLAATCAVAQSASNGKLPKRPKGHAPLSAMTTPEIVSGEGTTTASGLRYWDIAPGVGPVAAKGKAVKIHYTGWLESGKKFDSSLDSHQPAIFIVGAGQVIPGWDEGIAGMQLGAKRQLRVPSYLAYGRQGSPMVPPNSDLVYDVEVIGVQ